MDNAVFLKGYLASEVNWITTKTGRAMCDFVLAKNNGRDKAAYFFKVTAYNDVAKRAKKYLTTGDKIFITGTLATSDYVKNGVKVYSVDIIADDIEFLRLKKYDKKKETQNEEPVLEEDAF